LSSRGNPGYAGLLAGRQARRSRAALHLQGGPGSSPGLEPLCIDRRLLIPFQLAPAPTHLLQTRGGSVVSVPLSSSSTLLLWSNCRTSRSLRRRVDGREPCTARRSFRLLLVHSGNQPEIAAAAGAFIKLHLAALCHRKEAFEHSRLSTKQTSGFAVHASPRKSNSGSKDESLSLDLEAIAWWSAL
jgi:hypothetical protein